MASSMLPTAAAAHDSVKNLMHKNALPALVFMIVLIIIVIVLAYYVNHFKKAAEAAKKTGFQGVQGGYAGPVSNWYGGSQDAGSGKDLWSPLSQHQARAYMPSARIAEYHNRCGQEWDGMAVAEAQALTTLGSYQPAASAGDAFQSAVDAAGDETTALSDAQLTNLLHNGP